MREAWAAQMLEELDEQAQRLETLANRISSLDTQQAKTAQVLREASDDFRLAVTAFADAAKSDLREYVERQTTRITQESTENYRSVLQAIVEENLHARLNQPDQPQKNNLTWWQVAIISASCSMAVVALTFMVLNVK